ncbi:MAG: extracellular solute-binding protein [Clostridiales bacterium]|nr:extracellular solute-binding protein [Clostridiales bacterium]
MKKTLKCISAGILCFSLIMPSVACSKKKSGKAVKTVQESDPYYRAEQIELPIPKADPDLVLDSAMMGRFTALSSCVTTSYDITYVIPAELQEEYQKYIMNPLSYSEEDGERLMNEFARYSDSGVIVYNLDGSIRCTIPYGGPGSPSVTKMFERKDGKLLALLENYGQAPDWIMTYSIVEVTDSGELVKLFDLDCKDCMFSDIAMTEDGGFLCVGWSDVMLFDASGKCIVTDRVTEGEVIQGLFHQDGKYYILLWLPDAEDGISADCLREFDLSSGKLGSQRIESDGLSFSQGNDGIYYLYGNGMEKVDIVGRTTTKTLFSWNDLDVNRNGISALYVRSEDELYFVRSLTTGDDPYFETSGQPRNYLVKLTKEEKNPHAGKKILTVAAPINSAMIPNVLMDRIVDYNLDASKDIRIEYVDYSIMSTPFPPEDLSEAEIVSQTVDKVYLDMLSGAGPDILINFGEYSQFDNEKVLCDLNAFIDGENGLNRDDYFDHIFRACEKDGHLYQIPANFIAYGMVIDKQYANGKTTWNYEDLLSISKSLPNGMTMIPEKNWAQLLETLIYGEGRTFIDYENKAVHFDDPKFLNILEAVKELGSSRSEGEIFESTVADFYMGTNPDVHFMQEGMTAGAFGRLTHLLEFAQFDAVNDGNVEFIGCPGNEKGGFSVEYNLSIGISNSSAYQKEAWDFVKFLFDQPTQEECADAVEGFPVHRKACEEVLRHQVDLYRESMENMGVGYMQEYLTSLPQLDEKTVERAIALLENIQSVRGFDKTVFLLIKEEAEGYILGNRSAADVAKNIQNRTATVINERG